MLQSGPCTLLEEEEGSEKIAIFEGYVAVVVVVVVVVVRDPATNGSTASAECAYLNHEFCIKVQAYVIVSSQQHS